MKAGNKARKPTAKAAKPAAASHRKLDVLGLSMIALGLIIWVALATAQAGLVGDALGNAFRTLFGQGAWAAPFAFVAGGVGLVRGTGWTWHRFAWGLCLILVAALAGLSYRLGGDPFDPVNITGGGGYLGAVIVYATVSMIGTATPVGIGLLGLIGLVLVADAPIRVWIERGKQQAKQVREMLPEMPKRTPKAPNPEAERARMKPLFKHAVEPEPEPEPAPVEKPARRVPLEAPNLEEDTPAKEPTVPRRRELIGLGATVQKKVEEEKETVALPTEVPVPAEGYTLPPITLLAENIMQPARSPIEMQQNIETLEGTLEQFGIDASVVEVATGPTVTRYEIQLGPGVRVNRITALADNIAMDLAASSIRVEAPIPGKAAIGIEIPNATPAMVTLRELCETKEFTGHPSRLLVALGRDVSGKNKYADLTKMPHLLIGGATNSGKSIGLATLITSLLMRNTPKEVRLVMIDPKRVELTLFDRIPHLMCPVIKDVKEAAGVLRAVWREMDRRYDLCSEAGVRNIEGWNNQASFNEKLPYIVVIVDELADLMIQCGAEVETVIVRLAQLARAVGIHLVIATQRPSVDVITGLIKANIPSRIAFSVASQIDSRTIIDSKGAENLIGRGDMLFQPVDAMKPTRIQGCFVSEKEIDAVCRFWREQQSPDYVLQPVEATGETTKRSRDDEEQEEEMDGLWEDAVRWVVERGEASTSMLQRKFKIGFQRASRLLDVMEERGIVGPRDGPRPREVLLNVLDVDAIFGQAPLYEIGGTLDDEIPLEEEEER
jgi:S-DNA-T family DNA segregation ATPase FtsK/SpoIIIE